MPHIMLHKGPKTKMNGIKQLVLIRGVKFERFTIEVVELSKDKLQGKGIVKKIEARGKCKFLHYFYKPCWIAKDIRPYEVDLTFHYGDGTVSIPRQVTAGNGISPP